MSARHALRLGFECRQRASSSRVVLPFRSVSALRHVRSLFQQASVQPAVGCISRPPFQQCFGRSSLHTSSILGFAQQQAQTEKDKPSESASSLSTNKVLSEYKPEKLSEDIWTVPNVLTMARLASTPVLGYLVLIDEMPYALGLLAVSGFTDVLDGWLARRYKSATVFGSIADPAADKALMTVMVGALAWRGLIPLPLVLLIVGRDVALVVSAFLIRYRSLPEPKTFARYWDPRLPSAQVQPTQISKYNTFLQIILVAGCTLIASFNDNWRAWWSAREGLWDDRAATGGGGGTPTEVGKELVSAAAHSQDWGDAAKKAWHAFMVVVSITTVWSGSSYLFGGGSVYLSQKAKQMTREQMSKLRK